MRGLKLGNKFTKHPAGPWNRPDEHACGGGGWIRKGSQPMSGARPLLGGYIQSAPRSARAALAMRLVEWAMVFGSSCTIHTGSS